MTFDDRKSTSSGVDGPNGPTTGVKRSWTGLLTSNSWAESIVVPASWSPVVENNEVQLQPSTMLTVYKMFDIAVVRNLTSSQQRCHFKTRLSCIPVFRSYFLTEQNTIVLLRWYRCHYAENEAAYEPHFTYAARTIEIKLKRKQCFISAARRTLEIKHYKNARTPVKRFGRFRHAVLHMDCACCWNVSVIYFTYYATAAIKTISSTRNGLCSTILFQSCMHH